MSYRSFKRVLGETSLERKCRYLFGACLLLLITASFAFYGNRTKELVYEHSRNSSEKLVQAALENVHFEAALKAESTAINIMEDFRRSFGAIREDLKSKPSEAYFFHPDRSADQNPPMDDEERDWLRYFNSVTPDEVDQPYRERIQTKEKEYWYYQPVYAKKGCITCHVAMREPGSGTWKQGGLLVQTDWLLVGDLLAMAKIVVPDGDLRAGLNENRAWFLATAIVTVFLAMLASYVIVRYVIVKPLKHLRDVSDEISQGNIHLRADIHTADEFEELGVAFNRMLRHLMATQEELRHVNEDLDGKVDELAQLNMRLYELNRLRSDFLATMSHELRTPLNGILGFSEVLASIPALNDKQRRYVQNIQKSGRMLLEMINDILDLAKMESGKMELRLSDFSIESAVLAQCDMARPLAEKKNLDLDAVVTSGLPPMHQDQAKVQQILNNLISNAIKFTPEGGRITVKATRNRFGDLEMTVADTGVGIAEDEQATIFEKFRQGKTVVPTGDAMTREFSGTGLGLSIVKELCKLLGGEIFLRSQLGQGSTFTVQLPWIKTRQPGSEKRLAPSLDDLAQSLRLPDQRSSISVAASSIDRL